MDFGLPFTFEFNDQEWIKKIAIAALISLIPIIGQIYLLGWGLEITRKVINGENSPLIPETNFGGFLGSGFKAIIIALVYSIPIILFTIPITIASSTLPSADLDENTIAVIISAVSLCCGSLIFIYSLVLGLMLPAAFGNFAAKGNISDGLRFVEIFGLVKAAPVPYLIVLGGGIAASFVGSLGSIACGIGALLTMAYAMLINGHFYGQAYRQAKLVKPM